MNDYANENVAKNPMVTDVQENTPKFEAILGGIQESTAEIQSALQSIRVALHRFSDTNVPEPIQEQKIVQTEPHDLTGKLEYHSGKLMSLRGQAIELSRKINQLI